MKINIPAKRLDVDETVELEAPAYPRLWDEFEHGAAESNHHWAILDLNKVVYVRLDKQHGTICAAQILSTSVDAIDRDALTGVENASSRELFELAFARAYKFLLGMSAPTYTPKA